GSCDLRKRGIEQTVGITPVKGAFNEMNIERKKQGKPAISGEMFQQFVKPFLVENDLFPCTENLLYAADKVESRMREVKERYYPKPTSQERLAQKYKEVESEQPPEGLDRYQLQTWEKQKLQRLIECESAARFDAIAGELGLSISADESKALWEKSQGKV